MPESAHTVKSFDEDLRALRSMISEMGGMARAQVDEAVEALLTRDTDGAARVVAADASIDKLEAEAEAFAILVIARRAPMAGDLREVIAALKIGGVVERIGDYGKNIAKRVNAIGGRSVADAASGIREMAGMVSAIVDDALRAFATRDAGLAEKVSRDDAAIDAFYNSLVRSLLDHLVEAPEDGACVMHYMFIAKNLERIGDHATNVAEMAYYSATGKHIDERPKGDQTPFIKAGGA